MHTVAEVNLSFGPQRILSFSQYVIPLWISTSSSLETLSSSSVSLSVLSSQSANFGHKRIDFSAASERPLNAAILANTLRAAANFPRCARTWGDSGRTILAKMPSIKEGNEAKMRSLRQSRSFKAGSSANIKTALYISPRHQQHPAMMFIVARILVGDTSLHIAFQAGWPKPKAIPTKTRQNPSVHTFHVRADSTENTTMQPYEISTGGRRPKESPTTPDNRLPTKTP
mmetsp:Transcript_113969/g.221345  ORF Transcript_113969/g.221345 Transcript_113969/m.221345 type:complete len:228 (-) Transcript_113969:224-907(-)